MLLLVLPSGWQPQPRTPMTQKQCACLGIGMPNTQQTNPEGKGRRDLIRPFRSVSEGSSEAPFSLFLWLYLNSLKDKVSINDNIVFQTMYPDHPCLNLVMLLLSVVYICLYSFFPQDLHTHFFLGIHHVWCWLFGNQPQTPLPYLSSFQGWVMTFQDL